MAFEAALGAAFGLAAAGLAPAARLGAAGMLQTSQLVLASFELNWKPARRSPETKHQAAAYRRLWH